MRTRGTAKKLAWLGFSHSLVKKHLNTKLSFKVKVLLLSSLLRMLDYPSLKQQDLESV